jgi:uncharacterized protein
LQRFIFDTNVLVSAAPSPASISGKSLGIATFDLTEAALLMSDEAFAELTEVLQRSKFDTCALPEKRSAFLETLNLLTTKIVVTERIVTCRDPIDDKFLELALGGQATAIVTGDKDLLELHPFRDIPILTPKEFLSLHESKQP